MLTILEYSADEMYGQELIMTANQSRALSSCCRAYYNVWTRRWRNRQDM